MKMKKNVGGGSMSKPVPPLEKMFFLYPRRMSGYLSAAEYSPCIAVMTTQHGIHLTNERGHAECHSNKSKAAGRSV